MISWGFLKPLIQGFDLSSFLLGIGTAVAPIVLYWFNSYMSFKKENIAELKNSTKALIDIWANMKESALRIATLSVRIRQNRYSTDPLYVTLIPKWQQEILLKKQILDEEYNKAVRFIGHLYFYFDGYLIQNKLDALFEHLKNTDWENQTFTKSWRDLSKSQNQGASLLIEIKQEINALSTLWPRPIRFIVTMLHYWDIVTYSKRRWICVNAKIMRQKSFRVLKRLFNP